MIKKNIIKSTNGAIIPVLVTMLLAVLLMVSGFVTFLSLNSATQTEAQQTINILALSALKEYISNHCNNLPVRPTKNQILSCHRDTKAVPTINQVKSYLTDTKSILNGFKVKCKIYLSGVCYNSDPNADLIELKFWKYYSKATSNSRNCTEFPCADEITPSNPAFANAVSINVTLKGDRFKSALKSFFGGTSYKQEIKLEAMALKTPTAGYFLADNSSSQVYATNPEFNRILFSYDSSGNNSWLRPPVIPQIDLADDATTDSFYAQPNIMSFVADSAYTPQNYISGNPYEIPYHWNLMRATRAELWADEGSSPYVRARDDYKGVTSYTPSTQAYDNYEYRHHHIDPRSYQSFMNQSNDATITENYLVNLYRDPNTVDSKIRFSGEEPYLSTMTALNRSFNKFIQTGNPGDKGSVGIVGGTQDGFSWTNMGRLSNIHGYWLNVLDYQNFSSINNYNTATSLGGRLNFDDEPLWLRLGHFVRNHYNSDILGALRIAKEQLNSDPEITEALKFIVLITDGLPNCTVTGNPAVTTCANNLQMHKDSIKQIRDFVESELVGTNTALHTFLFSSTVRPEYLPYRIEDPSVPDGFRCATDEEIRAQGNSFVYPREISEVTESAWLKKHLVPISAPGYEFYNFARMTNGVFMSHFFDVSSPSSFLYPDTQASSEYCLNAHLSCGKRGSENWTQDYLDKICLSPQQRVNQFIDKVFENSSSFQVVEIPEDTQEYNFYGTAGNPYIIPTTDIGS